MSEPVIPERTRYARIWDEWHEYKTAQHAKGVGGQDLSVWLTERCVASKSQSAELTRKLEELTPLLSNAIRERNKYDAECDRLEAKVEDLEAKLAAMTEDRDLWAKDHGDDCPYKDQVEEQQSLIRELGDKVAELEIKITARESLLDRLNAANERLNKSWDILKASSDEMSELISQQAAAIERLTKYVSHDCGKQEDPLEPCTCGLDAVLSRQELAK